MPELELPQFKANEIEQWAHKHDHNPVVIDDHQRGLYAQIFSIDGEPLVTVFHKRRHLHTLNRNWSELRVSEQVIKRINEEIPHLRLIQDI